MEVNTGIESGKKTAADLEGFKGSVNKLVSSADKIKNEIDNLQSALEQTKKKFNEVYNSSACLTQKTECEAMRVCLFKCADLSHLLILEGNR